MKPENKLKYNESDKIRMQKNREDKEYKLKYNKNQKNLMQNKRKQEKLKREKRLKKVYLAKHLPSSMHLSMKNIVMNYSYFIVKHANELLYNILQI